MFVREGGGVGNIPFTFLTCSQGLNVLDTKASYLRWVPAAVEIEAVHNPKY